MNPVLSTGAAVLALAVLLALTHVPLGTWIHLVFTDEQDWRVERAFYRIVGVDPRTDQRWTGYAVSVVSFSVVSVVALFLLIMVQGWLPWALGRSMDWHTALNTAVSFITNTNWQSYSGEAGAGLHRAGRGAHRAELRLCRRGPGRRHRADPWHRAAQHRPDRQLLGRPGARDRPHPAADSRSSRRSCCWWAGSSRTSPTRRPSPRSPVDSRSFRAARSRRRRRSRSWAPTVAGSSTPTRLTPSRTRTRGRTSSRSS